MSGAAPIDFTSPAWLTLVRHMLDVEVINSELTPSEIRRFAQQFSHQNVIPSVLSILNDTISGLKFSDISCNSTFVDASAALLNTLEKAEKDFSRRVLHTAIKKAFGFRVAAPAARVAVSDASSNEADLYLKTALLAVVGGDTGASWAEYYKSQSTVGSTSFKYTMDASNNANGTTVYTVKESDTGNAVIISNPVKDIASAVVSMVKSNITNFPTGVVIPGLVSSDIPSGLMTMSQAIRFVLDASAISGVIQGDVTKDILISAYNLANSSKTLSDVAKIKLASNAFISKTAIYDSGLYNSDILKLSSLNEIWSYMPTVDGADRLKKPSSSSSGSVEFYTVTVSKLVKFFTDLAYTPQQIVSLISGVSNTTNDDVFAVLTLVDRYTIADPSGAVTTNSDDSAGDAGVLKGFAAKIAGQQPVASTAGVNTLHYLDFFLHNGGKSLDTADEIYNYITNFGLEKPTASDINIKGRWAKFKATYGVPRNGNTTDINVIYAALSKVALAVSPSATDASSISQWFSSGVTLTDETSVAGVTFSPLSSSNKALVYLANELKSTISIIENPNNYNIVNLLVKLGTESVYGSVPKLYARYSSIFALASGVLGDDFLKGVPANSKTKQASYNWAKTLTMDPVTLVRLGVSTLYGTVSSVTNLIALTNGTNFTLADIVGLKKMPSTISTSNTNLFSQSATYLFSTDSSMADTAQHSKNELLGTIFTIIINDCSASTGVLSNVDIGAKLVNGIVSILGQEAYEDFAFTAGMSNAGVVQTGMTRIEEFALTLGDYQNCCRFGNGSALTSAVFSHMTSYLTTALSDAYISLTPAQSQMISGYVSVLNRILTKELNVKYGEKRQTLPGMIATALASYDFTKKYAMIVPVELLAGPDKKLTKKEYDMLIALGVNPETIKQCCYAEVNVIGWNIQYLPGSSVKRMTYIGADSEGGLLFAAEA